MDAQQPGTFDKKAFIAAVKAAIEAKSPKTLKEADDYKKSGKAGEVKGEVKGLVSGGQGRPGQGHRDGHRRAAGPVEGRRQAGHPDGARAAGPGPGGPGRGRGAQAGPARAAQPRRRPARGQPGDGRRARSASSSSRSRTSRSSSRRWPTSRPPPRTPRPRPGSSGNRSSRSSPSTRPTPRRRPRPAWPACSRARARRWRRWSPRKAKTKTKDEAKRAEVTTKIQGIFAATEKDVRSHPRRARPEGRHGVHRRRGGCAEGVRDLRRRQDARLQEGPLRRLAGRAALGQGQAARDARRRSTSSTRPAASSTSSRWTG